MNKIAELNVLKEMLANEYLQKAAQLDALINQAVEMQKRAALDEMVKEAINLGYIRNGLKNIGNDLIHNNGNGIAYQARDKASEYLQRLSDKINPSMYRNPEMWKNQEDIMTQLYGKNPFGKSPFSGQ